MTRTALDYADDERLPQDPWGEGRTSFAPVYDMTARRDSLMADVNRAEATLSMGGGEVSAHFMQMENMPSQASVVTASDNSGMYQGMYGYGNGSSVSYHNEPCEVCGTKGMRRKWKYDTERGKMVKDGMVTCDACSGKGWSSVATTTYHPSPYWVTNDVTPNVPAMPQPYSVPLSPTVAPAGVPFYGSTTAAPPANF